jgi:hypothetical protein
MVSLCTEGSCWCCTRNAPLCSASAFEDCADQACIAEDQVGTVRSPLYRRLSSFVQAVAELSILPHVQRTSRQDTFLLHLSDAAPGA